MDDRDSAINQDLMRAEARQHELMEALSTSELRYRRLFESAKDGILLLDADKGTVYDVNPSLMEVLGYSHEDLVGKVLWEIGPVKNIEKAKNAFKELLKKEQAHYENLPLETSDGRIIEVEVLSSVYEVNKTRVVQCNFRDITKRNELAKSLAYSELRYRRLFESAKDGILLLDADKGTVYDVNSSLMKMLGYSHEDMVGKVLWEIGPIRNIEKAKDAFKELLEKEQARYENLPL
jgi:two-component system CheB/CheR fusion protein